MWEIELTEYMHTMKGMKGSFESDSTYRFVDLVECSRDFAEWHKNPSFSSVKRVFRSFSLNEISIPANLL